MATETIATVDDVLRLASAGQRFELIDGELVGMAPTGLGHGDHERRIGQRLGQYVDEHELGLLVVGEVLFRLDAEGRLARAADVAFIRRDRLPPEVDEDSVFDGPPDLAVEIVSPGDRAAEIERKVDDWLTHGTRLVLIVYPRGRRAILARAEGSVTLRGDDLLELDAALPGFRCPVSDLFR